MFYLHTTLVVSRITGNNNQTNPTNLLNTKHPMAITYNTHRLALKQDNTETRQKQVGSASIVPNSTLMTHTGHIKNQPVSYST